MAHPSLPDRADVLAFGPHPDDVEFCAGGFMLAMKKKGYRCVVVDLTRGEAGSRGTPESRAAETAAASEKMGLAARENLCLPDSALEATAGRGRARFERLTHLLRPLGEPQERVLSPISWVARHGIDAVRAAAFSLEPGVPTRTVVLT